jgi:hypothetical protein
VLGIQVADIAAAVAADRYERSGRPTRDAARELKNDFNAVFLKRGWL